MKEIPQRQHDGECGAGRGKNGVKEWMEVALIRSIQGWGLGFQHVLVLRASLIECLPLRSHSTPHQWIRLPGTWRVTVHACKSSRAIQSD